MKLGGYEQDTLLRAVRAYKEACVAYIFTHTQEGEQPSDMVIGASIMAGVQAIAPILHQAQGEAIAAYELAFDHMFAQALSNGLYDAWGKPIDCSYLNEAHRLAQLVA